MLKNDESASALFANETWMWWVCALIPEYLIQRQNDFLEQILPMWIT